MRVKGSMDGLYDMQERWNIMKSLLNPIRLRRKNLVVRPFTEGIYLVRTIYVGLVIVVCSCVELAGKL